ncbi:nickel transporter permease [Staphylococcus pettenkoferi]|uniref:nickel transporter permease n=1 Tax=Staphylococcus pettenkoferi TaxID=170573 RepID=UPI0011A21B93|nr:nickel transporter permease [Staphylococcus pettenkoferi]
MKKMIKGSNLPILLCLVYMAIIVVSQLFVSSHQAFDVHLGETLRASSSAHWLGTDDYGRDLFARIVIGARYTLVVTLLTLVVTALIGIPLGLVAGYYGGWLKSAMMRLVDIGLSIPEFVLMIALASFFKPSIWTLVIAIVLIKWMTYTRLTCALVSSEVTKPYVQMARYFHVPNLVIMWKHCMRRAWPSLIVIMTVDFGKIILYISSLSFLGLGAQPPSPEWGAMLNAGRSYMTSHPILMLAPAAMISLTILLFNLAGDALRDRLLDKGSEAHD